MDKEEKKILQTIAHTVRALSADAIEKQQSGHPGLPLGAAEIGAYLFAKVLRYNPRNPQWMGRDRFILSAGHGSMLLYSLLHLSGFNVSMEDIKDFRQLHSITPGHPEFGETPGVEVTTGPLGQGVATGTGMAIAQKLLATRFGQELFDSKIWVLAGDGCIMEGISAEAGGLAGSLGLDNLVLIYDSNDVCLDGPTTDCTNEDTKKRYQAYGFDVKVIDGYDFDQMEKAFSAARAENNRPSLIIAKTIIGKHCPNRQGKNISHGKFLGPEEMELFKKDINWTDNPPFYVPNEVSDYFKKLQPSFTEYEQKWNMKLAQMKENDADEAQLWEILHEKRLPEDFDEQIWQLDIPPNQPTRKYNEALIQKLAKLLPFFVTGSADVASVDFTWILDDRIVVKEDFHHQQIRFGVREFCMAACAYGMNLYGMIQPVIGTFLVFSDYMRNAIRMTAMMRQRVIFVFSHDSILIGQDGPTHQPVEQLMSLRLIPNLIVIRPGDENEAKMAWTTALKVQNQPVALCFSRQPVKSTVSELTAEKVRVGLPLGAYVLYGNSGMRVNVEIYTAGTEIHPSVGAAKMLETEGLTVRVISIPSWELFEKQDDSYKKKILAGGAGLKVSVEAGIGLGWQRFVGNEGLIISQETYGASAPEPVMAEHFGFTAEKVYRRIKEKL